MWHSWLSPGMCLGGLCPSGDVLSGHLLPAGAAPRQSSVLQTAGLHQCAEPLLEHLLAARSGRKKKKCKQTNHPNPAKLTGITCTHANLENSFFPSLLHLLSLYSRPDFMIRQFLPGHDVLVDYADAAYSHHIMMYGYLSTQMSVQTTFLWPLVLAFLPSPAWYTQCQVPCVSCSLQEAVLCKLPCHASPSILFYSK